jgi:uncharacterized protein YndB with AHSA1/START domain
MSTKTNTEITPIVKSVLVNCAPNDAFRYFTNDLAQWWPLAGFSCIWGLTKGAEAPETCAIEARKGGRLYERGKNGEEHDWGMVTVWEPPSRLAFTWYPGRDPETAQTVEVTFTAESGKTLVQLTHSGWEALGDKALETHKEYTGGWDKVFVKEFGEYANKQSA